jgi:FixJ family two-component response regulator
LARDGNNQERDKTKYQEEYQKLIANAHQVTPMVAQGTNNKNIGARIQKPGDLQLIQTFWLLTPEF